MTNKNMDVAILDRLRIGTAALRHIHTKLELPGNPSDHRQLDQRLSALKCLGLIQYLKKDAGGPGWALVSQKDVVRRVALL